MKNQSVTNWGMNSKIYSIVCACAFVLMGFSHPREASLNYIQSYADLAVAEMARSGIPASITLAQGLLESHYGTSNLATKANNHFGIKCKSTWQGPSYYHKDDDLNEKGELIKSCFRSYASPIDSYIDHSDFLTGSDRYAYLFELSKTDYIRWAHGLKKCGYATDPDYAIKLIKKIEQFKLYDFDYQLETKRF